MLSFQSHISETLDECKFISQIFPDAKHYTEVYLNAGLLTEKVVGLNVVTHDVISRAHRYNYATITVSYRDTRTGVNSTAFGCKLTLFSAIPLSRFSLKMSRFFWRISSWKKMHSIGLYRENAIAIHKDSGDSNGGNV